MSNLTKDPNDSKVNETNKTESKNKNRPMTVHTNKQSIIDINPFKQINNSTIKEENEIKKPKTSHYASIEIKQEKRDKKIKDNIYNTTINPPAQNIPPIINNMMNKKANSSNKKNVKYYVKARNNANKGNQRAFSGIKNDDAKTFQTMFNNLQSYMPKNDLNMYENNNFYKKKK